MKRRSIIRLLGWGIPVLIVAALILFPVFVHRSNPTLSGRCGSNLKRLVMATEWYMQKHNRHFPPTANWNEALGDALTRTEGSSASPDSSFMCPSAAEDTLPTYAMNSRLDGLSERDVVYPAYTVLYFESVAGRNLHGGPELFPPEPRHEIGYAVCFVNGRVEFVPKSEMGGLIWDPKRRPATE